MEKKIKFFADVVCSLILAAALGIVMVFGWIGTTKTVSASNSEYNGTIYAGDSDSGRVSLMVNVYWGNEFLVQMLDTFHEFDIKTTFFVGGSWAKANPELLKRIYDEGHEIGSHGYNHKDHDKLSYEQNFKEIKMCHDEVFSQLGVKMSLFAPPSGAYNKNTVQAATDLGYHTIMWTRDTIDWRDKDENLIYNRAVTNMRGGDLILMHPTACTAAALRGIIEYAIGHNLKLSTVSECLGL